MKKIDTTNAIGLFRSKCKKHGLKVTPQRTIVYEELLKATDHPSIDILLKRVRKILPNISFDTVYRTLLSLSKIGVVNIVEGYGGSKRFEPNVAPHHHFRCINCHRIIDFYNEYYDNLKIPTDIQKQFNVLNKKVLLEGLCKQCNKEK
jgi:Fur family peroxide stress response transcriptional regulator